jgi:uncharacterized protein (DUF305 family)
MTTSTESGAAATAAPDDAQPASRTRFGYGWIALALIVGLVAGLAAGYLALRPRHPADTSPEAGFLRDMSTHHAQAIAMSMVAHARSTDPAVTVLADDIALTQQAQVGYMQAWLRDWHLDPTGSQRAMAWMPDADGSLVDGLMPGMATPEQMTRLRAATGKELDVQFLTLMRAHHLGGIHMAQEILKMTHDEDITWLARTMVQNQQGEINLINNELARLGA